MYPTAPVMPTQNICCQASSSSIEDFLQAWHLSVQKTMRLQLQNTLDEARERLVDWGCIEDPDALGGAICKNRSAEVARVSV